MGSRDVLGSVLGGSWVVIGGVSSPLIWVRMKVNRLISPPTRGVTISVLRGTIGVAIRDTLKETPVVEVSGPPTNPLLILQRIPARDATHDTTGLPQGMRYHLGYQKGHENG